jgi:hypothetical protein
MANIVTGILGIAVVAAFLGFLMWWLKSVPLTLIMLGVIGLMAYDVYSSTRANNTGPRQD